MSNDAVIVDRVQAPIYVRGERFPVESNAGRALEHVERSGLVALTGITGAHARIVAPDSDKIWDWFTARTGIYNVTDHKGRFGRKGAKVNVVAHGLGHPLSRSQRVSEVLGTEYTKRTGTAQLSEREENELLSDEGTPLFAYDAFLEASTDPKFVRAHPSLRIVRTQDVLSRTRHGLQPLSALYDNSSVLVYVGGRTPVQVTTSQGEEKTVTVAQALVDRTGQRFKRTEAGVGLHGTDGGRVLFVDGDDNGLHGDSDLDDSARFVGVGAKWQLPLAQEAQPLCAGGASEDSPRSGDAPERVIVPNLEQVLALGRERIAPALWNDFEAGARKLYQN